MAKKKKKKTSKNFFEGEVIKTADYNKAHGIAEEQPALRSAAAEILAPIKEHRLNEPDMTRCSKCGHKCHCDSKKPFVYRTWIGEVGTNPPETKEYKCNKCHHVEVVKNFPKKKKKRIARASLVDLLDRKRFGKGAVKNETV